MSLFETPLAQVPALVAAGHRVIVPDLLGFGDSDKPQASRALGTVSHALPLGRAG